MSATFCRRCCRPGRGGDGSADAKVFRRAHVGECTECHTVLLIQRLANMYGPDTFRGLPESLRLPHVQEQFAAVMREGKSDATPDMIDWDRVIAVWDIAPAAKGTLF